MQFYLNILNGCPSTDTECIKYTRGALSANFFRSPEFQRKGSYVMYLYMVSIGQRPATVGELGDPNKVDRPHYAEFMADLQAISVPNDDPTLTEQKKVALTDAWMQRAEIKAKYDSLSNSQFVQALLNTAGVTVPNQSQLVADLNANTKTRAQVLRNIAESTQVNDKYYKQAFVTMEYFGYLRRDPDTDGFNFWKGKLDSFGGDYIKSEMVKAFISSAEYRQRFGTN